MREKIANNIKMRRKLQIVTIVKLQSLPSNFREFGGLLGRSATLSDCQEDRFLTVFENPRGSWEKIKI